MMTLSSTAGEIGNARMGDVSGLVRHDNVAPYAHFFRISLPQFLSSESVGTFRKHAAVAGAPWRRKATDT
ncbi:hypothetical protein SLE2022_146970 [Rubroshorea leprosula]